MNKFLIRFFCFSILSTSLFETKQINALVPYYYLPTVQNLEKESLNIGKNAYQLLYFGQIKESLNLAKLAIKINKFDENLWLILSEAEIANELYENALISLKNAQELNPNLSEIYFAKTSIYLINSDLTNAKISLIDGLKITPNNHKALFQLGNIYLMEKNYLSAIKTFDESVKIKADFWQAINNKGLAYYELDKINLSIQFFEEAISLSENAEPILGLASSLMKSDINASIILAKKALNKNHNYVDYNYRKEQLWGAKLQKTTENLLKDEKLKEQVSLAKSKINKTD